VREDRLRLVRLVESASAEVELRRQDAIRADKGQSAKPGESSPAGWSEFAAYLDAVGLVDVARFRLECFERRKTAREE
jgi:hypothetical protein